MNLAPIITRILLWLRNRRWLLLMLFVGVLIPLFVFGELAEDVAEHESFFFDDPILLFMHSHTTPLLDQELSRKVSQPIFKREKWLETVLF